VVESVFYRVESMKKWKLPLVGVPVVVLVAFLILPVDCESDGVGEWQMLTKQNFSSQTRLHPHILLFVTVPCIYSSLFLSLSLSLHVYMHI
jgi:hypothetical protein